MKPIVHYAPSQHDYIQKGSRALLGDVIDHYAADRVSNRAGIPVWTSEVVAVGEGGAFETLNTRYVPGKRA